MRSGAKLVILIAGALTGCETAHDVAVTSFKVIDAPANYIRHKIDEGEAPTTASTTVQSDVATPGHPVVSPTPPSQRTTAEHAQASEPQANSHREVTQSETKPAPSAQTSVPAPSVKLPYAKPVPGKPGYVYSPFDPNGGYVDVTGYAAGSKAKDPYTGKIFIVP